MEIERYVDSSGSQRIMHHLWRGKEWLMFRVKIWHSANCSVEIIYQITLLTCTIPVKTNKTDVTHFCLLCYAETKQMK